MSRPSVSCSARYSLTLAIRSGVVGAGLVQPEHRRVAGGAGAGDGQLDPVADRVVLGLAGAEDVAGARPRARGASLPAASTRRTVPAVGDLEGLVVAAVLLGLLRHQADVRDRAHRGRVEGAVGAAVVDDDLVDAGVAAVRHAPRGCRPPGRPGPTCGRRCGSWPASRRRRSRRTGTCRLVMPLSESTIASAGPSASSASNDGLDRGAVSAASSSSPARMPPSPSFGDRPGRGERLAVLLERLREEGADHVAEDDRVGDLHHRGLEVHREQHVLGLGPGDLRARGTRAARRRA